MCEAWLPQRRLAVAVRAIMQAAESCAMRRMPFPRTLPPRTFVLCSLRIRWVSRNIRAAAGPVAALAAVRAAAAAALAGPVELAARAELVEQVAGAEPAARAEPAEPVVRAELAAPEPAAEPARAAVGA